MSIIQIFVQIQFKKANYYFVVNIDNESFRFGSEDPTIQTTPLHWAVRMESINIVRHMLSNEAHAVEQRDRSGSTLLHVAAGTKNRYLCALLLEEHHANPDVVDQNGRTPLHRCQTLEKGVGVAEMLFQHCPSLVNRPDGLGKTALYLAVCSIKGPPMFWDYLSELSLEARFADPCCCSARKGTRRWSRLCYLTPRPTLISRARESARRSSRLSS